MEMGYQFYRFLFASIVFCLIALPNDSSAGQVDPSWDIVQLQAEHSRKCLSAGADPSRGVVQQSCDETDEKQIFTLLPNTYGGDIAIGHINSRLCLDVAETWAENGVHGTRIRLRDGCEDGKANQSFQFLRDPNDGTYQIKSDTVRDFCMDVNNGSSDEWEAIIQWTCKNVRNQKWNIISLVEDRPSLALELIAVHSRKCLTPDYYGNMRQLQCFEKRPDQLYYLKGAPGPTGSYRITNTRGDLCIDGRRNSLSIGLRPCNDFAKSQIFRFEDVGSESGLGEQFIRTQSGKCLDVSGGSIGDWAKVIQWDCHGHVNQQWLLNPRQ